MSFVSRWLITPYRDNGHLTRQQRRFNTVLSSLRQKVERAIGLLKGRWKKLLFLDHMDLQLTVHPIISACVLHNFGLSMMILMMAILMMMALVMMILMTVGTNQMKELNKKRPI